MPKTIYLVRHAKSSWDHPGLGDAERPLNKRGKRDAPRMAERLAKKTLYPERIITSPAQRARSTAQAFAEELAIDSSHLLVVDDIYGGSTSTLINIIRNQDDTINCMMLVGHNPAMTWLVNQLANTDIENVPTCGVAMIEMHADKWKEIDSHQSVLIDFDYPKKAMP